MNKTRISKPMFLMVIVNDNLKGQIKNQTIYKRNSFTEISESLVEKDLVSRETYINRSWQDYDYQKTMQNLLAKLKKRYKTDDVHFLDDFNNIIK